MGEYELNLRDYWQIIQKRRFVFILIFFTVFVATVIYTNMQKPVYRAVASVQWIERKTLGGLLTELVSVSYGDPLVTQSRIITSLPVLEKAVLELGLADEHSGASEIMEKARGLQGMLETDIVTGSNIIRIIATHGNTQMAANIANKVGEIYITENLREKSKQSRVVREFIERQLQEISSKLKNTEEALAKFKESEGPSGAALALQDRLAALETELQNLLRQYTQMHPNVKNIKKEISQLKEQLKALPKGELEYSRLSRDVEINAKLYRELKDKLEAARIAEAEKVEDASLIDRAVAPASPVSPNKPLNYLLGALLGLMLGLAGAFVVEHLDTSIGTIEDVEGHLGLPAFGIIPYLRAKDEKKANFIQRLWPRELKGKEKVLRLRSQLLVHYPSSSPIVEAYRILRTNIQNEIFKGKIYGKILLCSSAGPEEGKSITASNLAIVMAQNGLSTLLIDADMRRPVIHNAFGIKNKEPGLSNILSGTIEYKDAIRTITDMLMGDMGFVEALKIPGLDNLNIITSGSLPINPAELLGSPAMANLIESLRDKFDIIILDSPPVLAVTDATILASKADGVILVYRVGKTGRALLVRAKTQLVESGAQVKGVILNNISPEVEMRYAYYYHYKYYGKYYGEKKEET